MVLFLGLKLKLGGPNPSLLMCPAVLFNASYVPRGNSVDPGKTLQIIGTLNKPVQYIFGEQACSFWKKKKSDSS